MQEKEKHLKRRIEEQSKERKDIPKKCQKEEMIGKINKEDKEKQREVLKEAETK